MLHPPSPRRTVAPGPVLHVPRQSARYRRPARALAAVTLLLVLAGGLGALVNAVPAAVADALLVVGVTCAATLAGSGIVVLVRRHRGDDPGA